MAKAKTKSKKSNRDDELISKVIVGICLTILVIYVMYHVINYHAPWPINSL